MFWNRKEHTKEADASPPLDERMERIERRFEALADDFAALQERFARFQGRVVKRAAVDAAEAGSDAPVQGHAPDPASARILALRRAPRVRPGGVR